MHENIGYEHLIATQHVASLPTNDIILSLDMVSSSLFDNPDELIRDAESFRALDGKERKRMTRNKEIEYVPLWVCNYQNSIIDSEHIDICEFGELQGKEWICRNPSLSFDESIEYIQYKRFEEQCGEGEYIAQTYNVFNGNHIPIETQGIYQRSGIIDRRIQVINTISNTQKEWVHYVINSLKTIYAYDSKISSVILTRLNIIHDIIEWNDYLFHNNMSDEDINGICNILSWNINLMDSHDALSPPAISRWSGNSGCVPEENDITLYDFIIHEQR